MLINKASICDASSIAHLEKLCFSAPRSQKAIETEILSKSFEYFVAKDENGSLLGYIGAALSPYDIDITNIAVDNSHRRKKIGQQLLAHLLTFAKEGGFLEVFLEVRTGNNAAKLLYEKLNFKKVGVRKGFYQNPDEDADLYKFVIN